MTIKKDAINTIKRILAHRLERLRNNYIRNGGTGKELAAMIGTDPTHLSRVCNGKFGAMSIEKLMDAVIDADPFNELQDDTVITTPKGRRIMIRMDYMK